jgi:hypothetical protein
MVSVAEAAALTFGEDQIDAGRARTIGAWLMASGGGEDAFQAPYACQPTSACAPL